MVSLNYVGVIKGEIVVVDFDLNLQKNWMAVVSKCGLKLVVSP